jgi:pyruvate,water dikinase
VRHLLTYLFLTFQLIVFSQKEPPFSHSISNMTEFNKFSGEPLTDKFSQLDAVKVVYVISSGKIYYVNDSYAHLHYDFCKQFLNEYDDLSLFNDNNYEQRAGRKYYLGNLNYIHSTKKFMLEFSVADDISATQIQSLHQSIISSFIKDKEVLIYVNTPILKEKIKKSGINFKTIEPNEIYANQEIQVVNTGTAEGKLKKINSSEIKTAEISKNDILIIEGYSNDIPLCAGVIITTFQTPLSHITILSHNRKTPVIAYKNAGDNAKLNELIGEYVSLTITNDTFRISVQEKINNKIKTKKEIRLSGDLSIKKLVELKEIKLNDTEKYGAKACYLSELSRVKGVGKDFYIPRGGFSIPFYYYYQHIHKYGIDLMIENLLKDSTLRQNRNKLNEELACIRDTIKNSPIDTSLHRQVLEMIEKCGTGKRPRFRSSSNAEDLAEFNGAGLYDSKTGIPGDSTKTVERAIKSVWASLWNDRAFSEREYFNINQLTVFMGILVHESFPEEISNGVVITKNLYRDTESGYVINMQKGETSVVQPPEGVTGELLISYLNLDIDFYDDKNSMEYITYSSLNNNQPLLTVDEVRKLTKQLSVIKDHFYTKSKAWMKTNFRDYALDIEFKYILRNGVPVLLIKQARPYK